MAILVRLRIVLGVLAVLAAASSPLGAQHGTITGRLTDSATGKPLPGSSVQVIQTGKVVLVRGDGRYIVTEVSPGSYDVRTLVIGYKSQRKTVEVKANETVALDFSLSEAPYSIDELVVTVAGAQRRLEIGNSVSTIRADSLTQTQPIADMS
jgi:hypothetical protein